MEQLTGTLQVMAKDVKLQLEFNPQSVERYRLLGFENRLLDKRGLRQRQGGRGGASARATR